MHFIIVDYVVEGLLISDDFVRCISLQALINDIARDIGRGPMQIGKCSLVVTYTGYFKGNSALIMHNTICF